MKVALLGYPRHLSYDYDWISAFIHHYPGAALFRLDGDKPVGLESMDLVVLLHSATAQKVEMPGWLKDSRSGKLVMLTGNDYKLFDEKQAAADELGVDLICSIVPNPPYTGNVIHLPHALCTENFNGTKPHKLRRHRIGYRGYKYPDSVGDDERNRLVDACMNIPGADVEWSVFPRPDLYAQWLGDCKSTPATEAGNVGMKAISSRQFDAIGARAALVMFPGEYSGCLTEDHYIRLEKDLSNLDECLERVDDPDEWAAVTDRALQHCLAHHTYSHRMRELDSHIWQR